MKIKSALGKIVDGQVGYVTELWYIGLGRLFLFTDDVDGPACRNH